MAVRGVFVGATYAVVAAVVLSIYMTQWGLSDGSPRYGFKKMITLEAYRPFVYRLFMPAAINGLAALVPTAIAERIENAAAAPPPDLEGGKIMNLSTDEKLRLKLHRMQTSYRWADGDYVERLAAYGLMFGLLVAAQVCLRFIVNSVYDMPRAVSDFTPAIAALFLPFTFLGSGYLYDFADVFFISLTTLLLLRRQWWLYYPAFVFAVFNKETSVLLIFAFWAFHGAAFGARSLAVHSAIHVALGSAVVLPIRWWFRNNSGLGMEWHLGENVAYYLRPATYLDLEDIYAPFIMFPTYFNVVLVFMTGFLAFYQWRAKPWPIRKLFLVLFFVLLPLFVTGGWLNEVRVFYLCLPAYVLLSIHTLFFLYTGAAPRLAESSAQE